MITIIGATGTIGRHLLRIFDREGIPIRAIVRDIKKADVLFLLTSNEPGFAQNAKNVGVKHVVKLSALGASDKSRSWIVREHCGMDWTFLRPHAFMQNWLSDIAKDVKENSIIKAPIGDGKVPFIDARDIAEQERKQLVIMMSQVC